MLQRGASVGWKYPNVNAALEKVDEELAEVKEAVASGNHQRVTDELGDLLHATAAMAITANINPTTALESTNRKWVQRFAAMEEEARAQGMTISELSFKDKLAAWNAAKPLPTDGKNL